MRCLEIGGGPNPAHRDYEQFDAIDWSERTGLAYTLGDARKLPYENRLFDLVYASNLLEHFPESETIDVLLEWTRVLKPDGKLELVVPDSMGILHDFFSGVNMWEQCAERLRGSMDYDGNQHYAAFTRSNFADVIRGVSGLELVWCQSSHSGGGVHSLSIKRG
jgi:predicted SAM-dependent methyltransferase